MSDYKTLEELASSLSFTLEHETASKFAQGDVLLAACEPGQLEAVGMESQEAMLKTLGKMTGLKRRTAFNRMSVSRAFSDDESRAVKVLYAVFLAAAATDDPHGWLCKAADEGLSGTALRDEYAFATGLEATDAVELERVLRAATVRVMWLGGRKILMFVDKDDEQALNNGDVLQVNGYREKVQEMHQDMEEAA
jgi:hypothetical protein